MINQNKQKPAGTLAIAFTATEDGLGMNWRQEADCNGALIFQVLLVGLPDVEDKLGRMVKYRAAELKKEDEAD